MFAPLAPLGIWLGVFLHRRMSDRAFYAVSYTLLFVTGVKLIADASPEPRANRRGAAGQPPGVCDPGRRRPA